MAITTLNAFPSRDVFVAALGKMMYNAVDTKGEESLRSTLINARTPEGHPAFTVPVVLSTLVLFALCAQCSSTLVVIKQEAGAWGWAVFTFIYMTGLAYVGALLVYQATRLMGW